MRDTDLV